MAGDQQGGDEGENNDQDDDDCADNSCVALAETDPGILEIANGLVLKLLIGNTLAVVDQAEFFLGDL